MVTLKGSLRLDSMSRKLQAGIAIQGLFVLSLCYSYIYSVSAPAFHHEAKRDLRNTFMSSASVNLLDKPSSSVQSNTFSIPDDKLHRSCDTHISFFGIVPYWKEILTNQEHRNKRWIRNVLEGARIRCHDQPCNVHVSYTENPDDIVKSDVVIFTNIFQWMNTDVWDRLVKLRPADQKWIMSTQESPPYVPGLRPPEKYRNVSYDWSDTYRDDATFSSPYGQYVAFHSKDQLQLRQHKLEALIKSKEKSVAWVASHCETLQWNRTKFVKDLQEFIPIDTYGKCGTKILPWRRKELLRRVLEPYRFYLSFENSCCDQYITEKFWRSLDFGMIPVVVGAPLQDYLDKAPLNSFLHVDQFNSLKEMADYMIAISKNPSKMRKHLLWRTQGEVHTEEIQEHILNPLRNTTLCSISKKLRSNEIDRKTNLFDFYGENWEKSCQRCGEKKWMKLYKTS